MRKNNSIARGGFSLVEVAVATAIVGVGVTALMAALAAGTRTNRAGQELTQAVFLAQEIREWTMNLPFSDPDPGDAGKPPGSDGTSPQIFVDDLDDLLGVTYNPPRDGRGVSVAGMAGWSQTMHLSWRDPSNLTSAVANGASDVIHVEVEIAHYGQAVLSTGWLVTRR
jgi:prepilin-type N-terminal cleavage/methylation domain-containing protein